MTERSSLTTPESDAAARSLLASDLSRGISTILANPPTVQERLGDAAPRRTPARDAVDFSLEEIAATAELHSTLLAKLGVAPGMAYDLLVMAAKFRQLDENRIVDGLDWNCDWSPEQGFTATCPECKSHDVNHSTVRGQTDWLKCSCCGLTGKAAA